MNAETLQIVVFAVHVSIRWRAIVLIMMITFAMVMLMVMDCSVRAVKSLSLLRYFDV